MELLPSLAIAAPDWWHGMPPLERATFLGGIAGFVSLALTGLIAWDSRRIARKQLDIATEANKTTQLSVEDQIIANRSARTSSVRIAKAVAYDRMTAEFKDYMDQIELWDVGTIRGDEHRLAIVVLTLINDGMAPAYNVRLWPTAVQDLAVQIHHRGFRFVDELRFASMPRGDFLSIPPGHTVEFIVAFVLGGEDIVFRAEYKIIHQDGIGPHETLVGFGIEGAGMVAETKGWLFDVEQSVNENRRVVIT